MGRLLGQLKWLAVAFVLQLAAAQTGRSEEVADEAAVRAQLAKFARAFENRDADSIASLWDRGSPHLAEDTAGLRRTLANVARLKLTKTDVRALTVSGSKATAELSLDAEIVRSGKEGQSPIHQSQNRTLELTKVGSDWKLWRCAPSETLFSAELLAAPAEVRKQKLASRKYLMNPELIRAVLRHGYELTDRGKYSEATAAGNLGKELAEQIEYKEGMAEAFREMGGVHYAKREYREAFELFQQSLKLAQQIDYKLGIAKGLGSVGNVYFRQGNLAQALQSQQDALKLAEALGDNESIGWALNGAAQVYQQQGKFDEALKNQERILELRKQTGDKTGVAGALGNMGNIYFLQSRYPKALDYFTQTLEMAQSTGVRIWIPLALNNIGQVYLTQGNYIEALHNFRASVQVADELGAKGPAADALANIGRLHHLQGDDEQALVYYEKSRELYEQMGAPAPLAALLVSIGSSYTKKHQQAKALEVYSKALEINERLGSAMGIAGALENMGDVHRFQANYSKSELFYKRAFEQWEKLGNPHGMATSLKRLAQLYYGEGDFKLALENATRAASLAEGLGAAELRAETELTLGDSHRAVGELDQAERAYAHAISAIEEIRSRVAGSAQESELFFEIMIRPYHAMIALLVDRGDSAHALEFAERVKGRVLLDVLHRGPSSITKAMSPAEQKEEERLNAEIASLNVQIAREASHKQKSAEALTVLRERLRKARLAHESFETDLYLAHPELRVRRGESPAPGLDQLGMLLGDGKRAALEFVVGRDRSFLFLVTQSDGRREQAHARLDVFPLKMNAAELTRSVDKLRAQLLKHDSAYRSQARALFQQLVEPAAGRLPGVSELCIVPDGPLWELPFQTLLTRDDKYLVEDFAVFYSPSLGVLREMATGRQKKPATSDTSQLLAVGNPMISNGMAERIQVAYRDEVLIPLPEAEREVHELGQLYGRERSAVYTEADASEEQVKAEAGKYRVIHFATHGRLDDRSPLYSHLVLAPPGKGSKEDGLLEAWEVMKLELRADLAVLSACETARGRIGAGEGVIGMSWAFFVAGVPTTVVTHWKVESSSTSELMVAFHKNLITANGSEPAISKAEALRRAELQLLKKKRFRHPFYWASFAVVGDGM